MMRYSPLLPLLGAVLFRLAVDGAAAASLDVTVEYGAAPLALGTLTPRFSWKIPESAGHKGENQLTYFITVGTRPYVTSRATSEAAFESGVVWSTGAVASNQSVLVRPHGMKLAPGSLYYVSLNVTTNHRSLGKIP
jgi:hypothetical protein